MTWRKDIVLDEPKCLVGEPAARDGTAVLLHELTEIIGMDDVSFRAGSGESSRLEPTQVDPFLYFVGAGVQCPGKRKLGEPFSSCFAADAEPVQHRAHGPRRAPQDFRGLFYRHGDDQIKEALLLGFCPFAIRSFLIEAKLAKETQTGVSWVSGNRSKLCDQHSPASLIMLLASAGSFPIFSDQFSCFFRPAEHTALMDTVGFAHTAAFRRLGPDGS